MFNISGTEIVVILLLALVVLGPEKLPDAMRKAGRTYAELKRMSTSFQDEMRNALDEPMKEMRDTADLLRSAATFDPKTAATRAMKQAATKPGPAEPEPSTPEPVADAAATPDRPPEPSIGEPATGEAAASDATSAAPPADQDLIMRTLSGGTAPAATTPPPDGEAGPADDDRDDPSTA